MKHVGDVLSKWVESYNGSNAEIVYMLLRRTEDGYDNWHTLVLLSAHPAVHDGTERDFSSTWVDMSELIT